jgi:beta-glucosidase/6-phospho-beta-glucosidase/beta-galactosidase
MEKTDVRQRFMFATGVENSYPVIKLPDGSKKRVDEMEKCGHYTHWQHDFQLVSDLGIKYLRYGPPIHKTFLGPRRYDWNFSDDAFHRLKEMKIEPIVDLCHFGVPDWLQDFQNPDFPKHFAEYAGDFARRFPWIRLYTPVNEIYVAATFSAQYGWWNECLSSHEAFVTALKHLVQANILAMHAILKVRRDAIFIQSESSEYFHPANPDAREAADFLNEKRFLSLDLTYGCTLNSRMYEFLLEHGLKKEEYHWFLDNRVSAKCIMGNDYYVTNEHLVHSDGTTSPSGEIFGYYVITHQYFRRYRLPVMHTETNRLEPDSVWWLWKEWANVHRLRQDGVPILGFTWYSITDQVDWDTALREDNGRVNALGLFDLDRNFRDVGRAYQKLIEQWSKVLPEENLMFGLGY